MGWKEVDFRLLKTPKTLFSGYFFTDGKVNGKNLLNGQMEDSLGAFKVKLTFGGKSCNIRLHVVPSSLCQIVIGRNSLTKTKIENSLFPLTKLVSGKETTQPKWYQSSVSSVGRMTKLLFSIFGKAKTCLDIFRQFFLPGILMLATPVSAEPSSWDSGLAVNL